MAGHAQLKFVMTECSKTQIRLARLSWCWCLVLSLSANAQGKESGIGYLWVTVQVYFSLFLWGFHHSDIHSGTVVYFVVEESDAKAMIMSRHNRIPYEPRYEKTNKMSVRPTKTQISLGIAVRSVGS